MKKKVFRWVKVFVLVYCLIGIAVYYLQDKILFHPAAMNKEEQYVFGKGELGSGVTYEEINIPYDKETNLNIARFRPADSPASGADSPGTAADSPARGVILYFHGNRRNIGWYAKYAANFTHAGYEVLMMDYPGFGKSTGPLSEKKLYDYALVLYKLARSRYAPGEITIYGKSLGTGIAAKLAAVRDCRRLILETPYYSMPSLARRWLPVYPVGTMIHYRFPTHEFLPLVTAPITIFQGDDDGIVPYGNAARLKALLKPGDEFVTIRGGSHNTLNDFPLFHQKLDSVLAK